MILVAKIGGRAGISVSMAAVKSGLRSNAIYFNVHAPNLRGASKIDRDSRQMHESVCPVRLNVGPLVAEAN